MWDVINAGLDEVREGPEGLRRRVADLEQASIRGTLELARRISALEGV